MTTVVYHAKDGTMASDSSAMDAGTHMTPAKKLWRVGGGLVGMAGTLVHMDAFVRWLADGADSDEYPTGDYDAIVVDPNGRIRLFEGGGPDAILARVPYVAIGSGAPVALGALDAGADARQAVRIAIGRVDGNVGPVRSLRLRRG